MSSRPLRIIVLLFAVWAALALLLTAVESGRSDSAIRSFGDAAWYSLVTLTTVGYGDMYPVTSAGKAIGALLLLGSLGVLGTLVFKVSERIHEIRERRKMGHNGTTFRDHVLILGWNEFARAIAEQLTKADRQVAIVTEAKDDIDLVYAQFPREAVFVLYADLKDIGMLEKAGIERSAMVFPNLPSDTDSLIAILNIKKRWPDKRFVVALDNPELRDTFRTAGVTYVLSRSEIASKLIASYLFEPDVAEYATDLLSSAQDADEYDIQQYAITADNPYAGKTYGEAFGALKARYNVVPIGLCKVNGDRRELLKLPEDGIRIDAGDHLLMIVNGRTERLISQAFGVKEGVFET